MEATPKKTFNVLFICTGNSARSMVAEAIFNRAEQGRFVPSRPAAARKGGYTPMRWIFLKRLHYDVSGLR